MEGAQRDYGISIVNPYIEALDELIEAGKIKKRIDYRAEGCHDEYTTLHVQPKFLVLDMG